MVWLAWAPDLGMARHGDSHTTLDTPLPKSLPEAKKQDFAGCESLYDALYFIQAWFLANHREREYKLDKTTSGTWTLAI